MLLVNGILVILWSKLIVLNQVTNNLIQIGVNTLVYPKAKTQSDLEQEVCTKVIDDKLTRIGSSVSEMLISSRP